MCCTVNHLNITWPCISDKVYVIPRSSNTVYWLVLFRSVGKETITFLKVKWTTTNHINTNLPHRLFYRLLAKTDGFIDRLPATDWGLVLQCGEIILAGKHYKGVMGRGCRRVWSCVGWLHFCINSSSPVQMSHWARPGPSSFLFFFSLTLAGNQKAPSQHQTWASGEVVLTSNELGVRVEWDISLFSGGGYTDWWRSSNPKHSFEIIHYWHPESYHS